MARNFLVHVYHQSLLIDFLSRNHLLILLNDTGIRDWSRNSPRLRYVLLYDKGRTDVFGGQVRSSWVTSEKEKLLKGVQRLGVSEKDKG